MKYPWFRLTIFMPRSLLINTPVTVYCLCLFNHCMKHLWLWSNTDELCLFFPVSVGPFTLQWLSKAAISMEGFSSLLIVVWCCIIQHSSHSCLRWCVLIRRWESSVMPDWNFFSFLKVTSRECCRSRIIFFLAIVDYMSGLKTTGEYFGVDLWKIFN